MPFIGMTARRYPNEALEIVKMEWKFGNLGFGWKSEGLLSTIRVFKDWENG